MNVNLKVYSPCSCEACVAKQPWYRCHDLNLVAEYECAPFDGIPSVPSPSAVAEVERAHPGMRLVYINFGDHYEFLLERARRRLAQSTLPKVA
jgi:hypothetical protein